MSACGVGVGHPSFPTSNPTHTAYFLRIHWYSNASDTTPFILAAWKGQWREVGLWVKVSEGGITPKMTGWVPMTLWEHQSLCSCPCLLLLSVSVCSSNCRGFESGLLGPASCECLPQWPALSPHFGQGFSFSILLKQMASHGLSCPHRKKQCVFCQIHLKRQTLGFPKSCLPPAASSEGTASAPLSLEVLELCLFC